MKNSIFRRITLILLCISYNLVFCWYYENWLSVAWGYFGFALNPIPLERFVPLLLFSSIPAFWLPIASNKPSGIFIWLLYVFCYVPGIWVPNYLLLSNSTDVLQLSLSLLVGFSIISVSEFIKVPIIKFPRHWEKYFWVAFLTLSTALVLHVFINFRNELNIVNFANVYAKRAGKASEIATSGVVAYSLFILAGSVVPFIYAYSLTKKKWFGVLIACLLFIFLYSTLANKVILLAIIIIPIIFYLTKWFEKVYGLVFIGSCVLLTTVLSVLAINYQYIENKNIIIGTIIQWTASIVLMRTFAIQGLLIGQYNYFFDVNKNTYFSHIKGFNLFIDYPYVKQIGQEVGSFFYSSTINTNANFWAFDGIAGFDQMGIVLISIIVMLFLVIMNAVSKRHCIQFSGSAITFSCMNILNASFFTALLTGGLILTIIFLMSIPSTFKK